jgi:hypothetical protein
VVKRREVVDVQSTGVSAHVRGPVGCLWRRRKASAQYSGGLGCMHIHGHWARNMREIAYMGVEESEGKECCRDDWKSNDRRCG